MTSTNRTIVVKSFLNAEEYLAFDEACTTEDVSHSGCLRSLANQFVSRVNDRRRQLQRDRPRVVPRRAMHLPTFARRPAVHMRT